MYFCFSSQHQSIQYDVRYVGVQAWRQWLVEAKAEKWREVEAERVRTQPDTKDATVRKVPVSWRLKIKQASFEGR